MLIINFNDLQKIDSLIKTTIDILNSGGLVVYPTDTCYGLGVNALDVVAIKNLYSLMNRPLTKPTHVVVRDWEMIEKLCYTNSIAYDLYLKHFPGALTLVLNKKDIVPNELTGGLGTLGVRIPDYSFTKALSQKCNFPFTTTSAKRLGENTPYSIDEVRRVLDVNKIDLIIDGGKLPLNPASTIVDVTNNELRVLRQGAIKL